MGVGTVIGTLFFLLITFAAITSAISLLEPTVEFLEERTAMTRTVSTIVASTVIWLLGIAALLSFNLWSEFTIMGNGIFDALDKLTSKFLLPLTGLAAIVFLGWKMDQRSIQDELGLSNGACKDLAGCCKVRSADRGYRRFRYFIDGLVTNSIF